jgi:DNA-binding winged helix-turn-helix (wHTH) protein
MLAMDERKPTLRFGLYEADLDTGELFNDGVRVPLQQQPFRVLAALLNQPGELVTREQLRKTIWRDGTFVAFERGLTSAVRKVREALGERADTPVFIETLPGRGYRFIAPVSIVSAPARRAGHVERPQWLARAAAIAIVVFVDGGIGPSTFAAERLAAAEALSEYACLLKSQGRFEEGLATIRRAHAIAPEFARFTAEVGLHLHAIRDYEAELPMLLSAVDQDRGSVDAWLHLGLGYARRANFDRAVPALERAAAVSRGSERVNYWLAWARQQRSSQGS